MSKEKIQELITDFRWWLRNPKTSLTPRLLNLILESKISENSLVCVTSDGWPSIYSSCRSVLRLMLSLDATSSVEVTFTRSWAREIAKWGRPASPRPAGLGFVPFGTALLLDVLEVSWWRWQLHWSYGLVMSMAVALVQGLTVRGWPAGSRPAGLTSACFVPPFYQLDDQHLCFVQGGKS
jgi:hypothetical protein